MLECHSFRLNSIITLSVQHSKILYSMSSFEMRFMKVRTFSFIPHPKPLNLKKRIIPTEKNDMKNRHESTTQNQNT